MVGIAFGILLGFLGGVHPALDTVAHFRLHFSVGLLALCLLFLLRRRYRSTLLFLPVAAMGLYTTSIGTVLTAGTVEQSTDGRVYSLFHFNLFWRNTEKQQVIDRILELDPDLISLTEASKSWTGHLELLNERWPHLHSCPEWGKRGGVRFYSKWPLDLKSQYCGPYGSFAKSDILLHGDFRLTSGSVHLRWPWPASGPEQVDEMLPEIRKTSDNALLAGDFNATSWSWTLARFADAGGMEIVPGIGSTWMFRADRMSSLVWAGLPVDNVLKKGDVKILSATTLSGIGSDHLPVLVRFQVGAQMR